MRPTSEIIPTALLVRGDRYGYYEPETRLEQEMSPQARMEHRRSVGLYNQLARMPA